ncbi:MAG: peptidoglycan-associated lipoprotein Pal [Holophagaceae bacterium]|nr:peptidoglycan-associated lipoprotein Pal [Holophagaceae bacterium]
MTRPTITASAMLAGAILLGTGLACKKPEPMQAPAPVKQGPTQAELDAKAAADRKAAEEAKRRQAELEAAKKAEEAKRLAAENAAALKRAAAEALKDIHFDYDKSEIKAEDRAQLQKISDFLKAYPAVKVEIQGHCDERGTNEYNLALGNRRASATLQYLMALGSPDQKFTLISFGKEKPLCTEGNEACWRKNRRAHFELK